MRSATPSTGLLSSALWSHLQGSSQENETHDALWSPTHPYASSHWRGTKPVHKERKRRVSKAEEQGLGFLQCEVSFPRERELNLPSPSSSAPRPLQPLSLNECLDVVRHTQKMLNEERNSFSQCDEPHQAKELTLSSNTQRKKKKEQHSASGPPASVSFTRYRTRPLPSGFQKSRVLVLRQDLEMAQKPSRDVCYQNAKKSHSHFSHPGGPSNEIREEERWIVQPNQSRLTRSASEGSAPSPAARSSRSSSSRRLPSVTSLKRIPVGEPLSRSAASSLSETLHRSRLSSQEEDEKEEPGGGSGVEQEERNHGSPNSHPHSDGEWEVPFSSPPPSAAAELVEEGHWVETAWERSTSTVKEVTVSRDNAALMASSLGTRTVGTQTDWPDIERSSATALPYATAYQRHRTMGDTDEWLCSGALTYDESLALRREMAVLVQQLERKKEWEACRVTEAVAAAEERMRASHRQRLEQLRCEMETTQEESNELRLRLELLEGQAARQLESALSLQEAQAVAERKQVEVFWKEQLRAHELQTASQATAQWKEKEEWLQRQEELLQTLEQLQATLTEATVKYEDSVLQCKKHEQHIRLLQLQQKRSPPSPPPGGGSEKRFRPPLDTSSLTEDGVGYRVEELYTIIEEMGNHQASLLSQLDQRSEEIKRLKEEHQRSLTAQQQALDGERSRNTELIQLYSVQVLSLQSEIREANLQKTEYRGKLASLREELR